MRRTVPVESGSDGGGRVAEDAQRVESRQRGDATIHALDGCRAVGATAEVPKDVAELGG
jgi:hypothetical protein